MTNVIQIRDKEGNALYPITDASLVSGLANVATSGSYNDLSDTPTPPAPEIFWATYGTTTAAEIDAAVAAGKAVMLLRTSGNNTVIYHYIGRIYGSSAYDFLSFTASYNNLVYYCRVRSDNNNWDSALWQNVGTSMIKSSWSATPSNGYVPSEKLVYDSLGKMGVLRQTQTWTQAADGGYDYTMSNPVRGLIPQANIDLFESAGAVFNEQTGYFELNGLTDVSYEEMQEIYAETYMLCRSYNLQARMREDQCRTNIPFYGSGTYAAAYQANGFCIKEPNLEVLMFQSSGGGCDITGLNYAFYNCPRLRRIAGQTKTGTSIVDVDFYFYVNSITSSPTNLFVGLVNLESVFLNGLRIGINFSSSPRLLPECIAYMINNSNTSAANFTITLHATAYARATADPAVQAALAAHTNVTLASN